MLSIIIANWNTRELLRKCLQSIFNNTKIELEVIVIDNGSSDDSVEMIKKDFPPVELIENKENTGFVFANNQGMEASRGDFVLLLNSDTEVLPGGLDTMVEWLKNKPEVGVVGCRLRNVDRSQQLSVRRDPSLLNQIIILTKFHNFFPSLVKKYILFDFDYDREQEVEQVMGAFMLIRREVIEKIGVLDKNIFSWFEDVDYCDRARAAGWKIYYTPAAEIIHLKGQSFTKQLPFAKQKVLNKSLLYYFRKHHGFFAWLVLLPFVGLSYVLAWGVQIFGIKKINKEL